jgi:large subunit ribosomal protein L24
MKQVFSKSWKSSKQPRKQRKYQANAPLSIKKKFLSTNISKTLRTKIGKRNVVIRKGDIVKIMRGSFKGKSGKVEKVLVKYEKIYVEGITRKKMDGSKVNVPLKASNLQITEMVDRKAKQVKKDESAPKGVLSKESKEVKKVTSENKVGEKSSTIKKPRKNKK